MMSVSIRSTVSVGILVVLIALCVILSLAGFVAAERGQQLADAQTSRLAALRARLGEVEAARRNERRGRPMTAHDASGLFLANAAVGLAAATLQKDIIAEIESRHGALESAIVDNIDVDSQRGATIPISLDIVFSIKISGLKDLLFDIESRTPLTFVDRIEISGETQSHDVPQNRLSHTEPTLRVSMRVTAYLAPAAPASAKPAAGWLAPRHIKENG